MVMVMVVLLSHAMWWAAAHVLHDSVGVQRNPRSSCALEMRASVVQLLLRGRATAACCLSARCT